jgi:hypothetical protein
MADLITLAQAAIVGKLTSNAGIIGMGARVYEQPAPESVAYPFFTVFLSAVTDLNQTPRRAVDFVVFADCWDYDSANAAIGAGYIDQALRNVELTITGWSNYRTNVIALRSPVPELVAGRLVCRRGLTLKVSIDSNVQG